GTSATVKLGKPNVAGNLLVAYVVWDNGGAASVSDTLGNVWASAVGPTQAPGDPNSAQIFYAANARAGRNTITATFATPVVARGVLHVFEYRGFDRTAPVDATAVTTGTTPGMSGGPLTTTVAGDLVFVGGESNGRSIFKLTRGYKTRLRRYGNVT